MKRSKQKLPQTKQLSSAVIICPLCLREILTVAYDVHFMIHERAEMLADILALSRR